MMQDGLVSLDWLSWGAMVLKEVDPGCLNEDQIFLMTTLLHQLNLLNMVSIAFLHDFMSV